MTTPYTLGWMDDYWKGGFGAMASPCEVLLDLGPDEESLAARLTGIARDEAVRIERKFSRYRSDNIIHRINTSGGAPLEVDAETASLLDYAAQCHRLSDGLFDITSGVLREVWRFDGSDRIPAPQAVAAVLARVGWDKVEWRRPLLRLPAGMQIDLGGIGKEYAVDRTAALLRAYSGAGMLINFGGDLLATGPRMGGRPWQVAIDDPGHTGRSSGIHIALSRGAIATSGDARRFLLKEGKRYSHILDPRTGWPVRGAPRAVTVLGADCTEAGMLATFAMLHGARAEAFLEEQEARYWCQRSK